MCNTENVCVFVCWQGQLERKEKKTSKMKGREKKEKKFTEQNQMAFFSANLRSTANNNHLNRFTNQITLSEHDSFGSLWFYLICKQTFNTNAIAMCK